MPVYTYSCNKCGIRFEKRIPFDSDNTDQICPNGHKQVQRKYSPPAVVFKGSGWYSTDNRSKEEKT